MKFTPRFERPAEETPHEKVTHSDADRMGSKPFRRNQNRYSLRESPIPRTDPDFLIDEITQTPRALQKVTS